MLVVETVARVRRAYFVQEKSIKEIARDLKVSRKTVRKVIRSGATSFHYARGTQPAPKLGPWRDALDGLLLTNAGKSARERLTLRKHPVRAAGGAGAIRAGDARQPRLGWPERLSSSRAGDRRGREPDGR